MAKILLVDDEPRIARVVRDMVEGADWQFAYADNGADALDAVARETPDLIIMDVMMPKMDGFTACRELRARGVTVPVIFLSAKGDIVDKGVGFAAGGDDYMVKPFDPRELMMHIEAHLRRAGNVLLISAVRVRGGGTVKPVRNGAGAAAEYVPNGFPAAVGPRAALGLVSAGGRAPYKIFCKRHMSPPFSPSSPLHVLSFRRARRAECRPRRARRPP